jgi:hypothetical protein
VALLAFLDDHPRWTRLLATGARAPAEVECRRRVHDVLGNLLDAGREVDEGRVEQVGAAVAGGPAARSRELTRELVLGGVFSVIAERVLDPDSGPLGQLAPSLESFIATSYAGRSGASQAPNEAAGRSAGPLDGLPIRATYRTTRVLRAIGAAPRSSNREVAQAAELSDEGQTSKLLGRLERRGLIENVGLGAACGEPNAWVLTAIGRQVVVALQRGGLVPGAPRRAPRYSQAEISRRPHDL